MLVALPTETEIWSAVLGMNTEGAGEQLDQMVLMADSSIRFVGILSRKI